jgi:hypothetical protein
VPRSTSAVRGNAGSTREIKAPSRAAAGVGAAGRAAAGAVGGSAAATGAATTGAGAGAAAGGGGVVATAGAAAVGAGAGAAAVGGGGAVEIAAVVVGAVVVDGAAFAFFAASFAASLTAAASFAVACLMASATAGAPETNTLVVALSPGAANGAGAADADADGCVFGGAGDCVATLAGLPCATSAGLLRVNHQIAAATADSATPPMMSGILLLVPLDGAVAAVKVDGRRLPEAAVIGKSASELANPSFWKRCKFVSTSAFTMPLNDANASTDIGVLRSARSLR